MSGFIMIYSEKRDTEYIFALNCKLFVLEKKAFRTHKVALNKQQSVTVHGDTIISA